MHHSIDLAAVFFHVSFIEFTVGKEDLDDAIHELPTFKSAFNYLIGRAEQDSLALRATLSPFSLVNGSIDEFTDARAVSQVIFPVAFVNIAVWKDHLSLTMLESLGNATVINVGVYLTQLLICVVHELMPVQRHSFG